MSDRHGTFIERILDGHARIDQLEDEIAVWAAGPRRERLDQALGLNASELELIARAPDALRYIVQARRFGLRLELTTIASQKRIRAYAAQLAALHMDPFAVAELEHWQTDIDELARIACARAQDREPSHA